MADSNQDFAQLISTSLLLPETAIDYAMSAGIRRHFGDRHVLRTSDTSIHLDTWLRKAGVAARVSPAPMPLFNVSWKGQGRDLEEDFVMGHRTFEWEGQGFDVIQATWSSGMIGVQTVVWWVGPDRELVEKLVGEVAEVANTVEDEVLVFAHGYWARSQSLHQAIQRATFDSLILKEGLATSIRTDFSSFLESREEYQRYRVPWKRGALFLGPPGNGKTHCVKALLNELKLPCFYVQSFDGGHGGKQAGISAVFDRVRRAAPGVLVLEDLDSLLTNETRAFFLNELDGFADNTGIITIATTNHPERLDPAILERPSRFDRKYFFELPGVKEREGFLDYWSGHVDQELDCVELAGQTDGFSFAYLQELVMSSLIKWMSDGRRQPYASVVHSQVATLRQQMATSTDAAREYYAEL